MIKRIENFKIKKNSTSATIVSGFRLSFQSKKFLKIFNQKLSFEPIITNKGI